MDKRPFSPRPLFVRNFALSRLLPTFCVIGLFAVLLVLFELHDIQTRELLANHGLTTLSKSEKRDLSFTPLSSPSAPSFLSFQPSRPPPMAQQQPSSVNPLSLPRGKANAVILILARNEDLEDLKYSLRQFQDRFNRGFQYPYLFLNNAPFTLQFMESITKLIRIHTPDVLIEFDTIPPEHWSYPSWINQTRARESMKELAAKGIAYGGSEPYRHMIRYFSGFFFRHPKMAKYELYWRVEPGVQFFCDIDEDPFLELLDNNKTYGFTISLLELPETVESLWGVTLEYATERGLIGPNGTESFLAFFANWWGDYNMCHFWSNFEIARLDFFRSKEYMDYFEWLDKKGGFFYERWGDAPVHSLATGLFLRKDQIHFYDNIGYQHDILVHCSNANELQFKCQCPENLYDYSRDFDYHPDSCLRRFEVYQMQNVSVVGE